MNDVVRKVGRPTRDEAAAIDDRVLDGAAAEFRTHGFEGVSMDRIAHEVGTTKHTIYRRYPSKAALRDAVIAREIDTMRLASSPIGAGNDPLGDLERAARGWFNRSIEPEAVAFVRFLFGEMVRCPELKSKFDEWGRHVTAPLEQQVVRAQAAGRLLPGDPGVICEALLDLIEGAANRLRHCHVSVFDRMTPDEFFDLRWEMFIRAMGTDVEADGQSVKSAIAAVR